MAAQRFDDTQHGVAAADGAATPPHDASPSRRSWVRVLAWMGKRLGAWPARRARSRELGYLSDYLLRDIGVDPASVQREPMPPTWDLWRG
jgi:uncharacterized protein YjiS (DUF1127 family)